MWVQLWVVVKVTLWVADLARQKDHSSAHCSVHASGIVRDDWSVSWLVHAWDRLWGSMSVLGIKNM